MRTAVPFTVKPDDGFSKGVAFPLDGTIKGLVTSPAACGCGICAVEQELVVGLVTGGGIWLRPALSLRECDIRDGCVLSFRARGTLRGGARKDKGKGKGKVDDMWLEKAVNSVDLGGACKKKYVGKARHIKGARYDGGDWRVAVVWYERAGDDKERLTFREPPSDAGVDFSAALRSASTGWMAVEALRWRCRGGSAPCGCQGKRRPTEGPGAGSSGWCVVGLGL